MSIKFNAATIPYPDTTRAELEAIISLLLATPNNTHIHIHLDNKTAIKNLKQKYYTKILQNQNWDILLTINQIKSIKNLTFTLHKVKSHSNSLHNQADLLAKRETNKPIFRISYNHIDLPIYFQWENYLILFKI